MATHTPTSPELGGDNKRQKTDGVKINSERWIHLKDLSRC